METSASDPMFGSHPTTEHIYKSLYMDETKISRSIPSLVVELTVSDGSRSLSEKKGHLECNVHS